MGGGKAACVSNVREDEDVLASARKSEQFGIYNIPLHTALQNYRCVLAIQTSTVWVCYASRYLVWEEPAKPGSPCPLANLAVYF